MASIEERVEGLLESTINNLGYELYDVEYAKEGKDHFLRIFIDKDSGIDLNDCEKVNDAINELLDKADYIKEQYFLEVSSPGIERILKKDKHLQANIGSLVEAKLFKATDNKKAIQGILKDFNKDALVIETEDRNVEVERKNISIIKTVYNW